MGWFTNFVSELTGSSTSKAAEAGHDARADMDVPNDKWDSAPDVADKTTDSGISLFPEGK